MSIYTIFVGEFGFCFAQNVIYYCNHLHYFANMGKTVFRATFLTNIFTGTPTLDLNGAMFLGLILKIIFENIKQRT